MDADVNASVTAAGSVGSTVREGPDGCIEIECSLTGSPYDLRAEQYGSRMVAVTLESAKSIGITVVLGLVALMVVIALVVKNVTMKLISFLILGGLAFGVWTQRSSLQDCADKVRSPGALDVTCTFLGSDVKITTP